MAEQLPPLDSALEHESTKSKAPMYADVDSSKVAICSNSNDLVPLPLNYASSFLVPLPMPPLAAAVDFVNEFVSLQLNSAVIGAVSLVESYSSIPLPIATPPPLTTAVDFDNECAYYKSKPNLTCAALNQVNPQFNVVNNAQFQPPVANANGITSYYNFASEFVPLSLNTAVTDVVSSPLPMAPPHSRAVDFNSECTYYKSRPDISYAATNQVNQQFNVKDLKKIASELSQACSKRKENCDTSHYWNRVAIIDRVTIIARVYTSEKQLMRVTGFHSLDDPVFISIVENAGLNLSDVRSLIHAPTYLISPIPPYLNQLVSTFSNALHPQGQQVQNQNFLNTGLHEAILGWDNNQQKKWWKDLDFATKLPFARDRIVECYFWIVSVDFEPQYSLARKILTKVISTTSIVDDIYDAYGTLEELEPFTEAIERWDISCIDQLPEYMQICYHALFDVFEEIENELAKKERSYRVSYAKDAMKRLVRAYFDEAKWLYQNYIPTMEEYMHVGFQSSGYPMLIAISFLGMGDIVTKEAFDWIFSNPKIITASSVIARLIDDMKSHKFEQERGHAPSAVECYMKQHGVSEQVVHDEFNRQVANAWKDINEECIRPTIVPMPLLMRVLNLTRVVDVIYKEGDSYTHVGKEMKDNVASVLIDPIPI
nr:(-)-germacrene d synthase [Quercus suber]